MFLTAWAPQDFMVPHTLLFPEIGTFGFEFGVTLGIACDELGMSLLLPPWLVCSWCSWLDLTFWLLWEPRCCLRPAFGLPWSPHPCLLSLCMAAWVDSGCWGAGRSWMIWAVPSSSSEVSIEGFDCKRSTVAETVDTLDSIGYWVMNVEKRRVLANRLTLLWDMYSLLSMIWPPPGGAGALAELLPPPWSILDTSMAFHRIGCPCIVRRLHLHNLCGPIFCDGLHRATLRPLLSQEWPHG